MLAWLALALQLTGVFSFDALHPAMLAGCAPRVLSMRTSAHSGAFVAPVGVTEGITLRRANETLRLPRGTLVEASSQPYQIVGLDRQARVLVLHDRRLGLQGLPITGYTLGVKRMRKGGRIGAVVASGVAGAVGGLVAGLAVGVSASSNSNGGSGTNAGAAFGGCLIGLVAGGALGAGTTIAATADTRYVLAPSQWQIDEGAP